MWKMYEMIKISSIFIRQYLLPNPFGNSPDSYFYNLIAGFILYPITYCIVGLFYRPRSNPLLGSFLYLLFYSIHTGMIILASTLNFSRIAIAFILSIYIGTLIGVKYTQIEIFGGWY